MPCDEQLVARVRAALQHTRGIAELRMFGGVCFTLNGNMACGVVSTDLMVRVGPDKYDAALKQPHVREMDFTGRAMKGYVFVSVAGATHLAAVGQSAKNARRRQRRFRDRPTPAIRVQRGMVNGDPGLQRDRVQI